MAHYFSYTLRTGSRKCLFIVGSASFPYHRTCVDEHHKALNPMDLFISLSTIIFWSLHTSDVCPMHIEWESMVYTFLKVMLYCSI